MKNRAASVSEWVCYKEGLLLITRTRSLTLAALLCRDAVRLRRPPRPRRVRLVCRARVARHAHVLEVVNGGDAQARVAPQPLADEPLVFEHARPLGARLRGRKFHARQLLQELLLLAGALSQGSLDDVIQSERNHSKTPFHVAACAAESVPNSRFRRSRL